MSRNVGIGSLYERAILHDTLDVRTFASFASLTAAATQFSTIAVGNPVSAAVRWMGVELQGSAAAGEIYRPRIVTEAEADAIAVGGNWDATLVTGYAVSGKVDDTDTQKSVMATFEALATYDPASPDGGVTQTTRLYGNTPDHGVFWVAPGRVLIVVHETAATILKAAFWVHEIA